MPSLLPESPEPRLVMSSDGLELATYEYVEGSADTAADAPVVLAVHGFASSAWANWSATGWTRELTRAGFRVIALDQRGHGASSTPHDPSAYRMEALVDDVLTVLDTYLLDEVDYVGYSLGARVGWHAALELPTRIRRAVLGGVPDATPLTRFQVDQARAYIADGTPVADRLTQAYLTMAERIRGNDLAALVSLVEGMRGGPVPDADDPPRQPLLFATGSDDPILEGSKALAAAAPGGEFLEIPKRNHFNAPTSRHFREGGIRFLQAG